MLRVWLLRAMPFLDRWIEVAPACCGLCAPCVTASATGVTTTLIGSLKSDARRDEHVDGDAG